MSSRRDINGWESSLRFMSAHCQTPFTIYSPKGAGSTNWQCFASTVLKANRGLTELFYVHRVLGIRCPLGFHPHRRFTGFTYIMLNHAAITGDSKIWRRLAAGPKQNISSLRNLGKYHLNITRWDDNMAIWQSDFGASRLFIKKRIFTEI